MFSLTNLTDEFLAQKRQETDPLADLTVAAIIDQGYEDRINEIFYTLARNHSYHPELLASFPDKIREIISSYFSESSKLPEWADNALIAKGQEVFNLYGPEVFMLLNLKSLPMCYTCANGAQVLYDTGRLVEHKGNIDPLVRRLMETAQMVVNVLQPGGLEPNGQGIITVQKVRLIHASIRHFLKSPKFNAKGWDSAKLGEPINQEDLAGTLMSFSPIILSGLRTLKIDLTYEQIRAYTHCWKVIGHLIGLKEDLLADKFEDNWVLACAILKHQAGPSEGGKALSDSCVAFIKHMIPGNLFDDIPEYMIWYFFQDAEKSTGMELSKMIGISDHSSLKDHLVLKLSEIITGGISHAEHDHIVQKLTGSFNKLMLQGYIRHYNEGKNVRFLIPPSLTANWGINEI
ncbi:MAG: oxygenase MpaB family protein [Marinoscillum sp.]